jgi:SAM-dependent methyltransferase
MAADGPIFYDVEGVFARYMAMRQRRDSPNETMEAPVIDELIGDVRGLRVVDLGCGAGAFGVELLDRGVRSYVGVEGARKMAAAARARLKDTPATVVEDRIERWDYPAGAFDLAVSRLALHYVAEVAPVFAKVAGALAPGGRFVFSVEHPVITSCTRGWKEGTVRRDWIVDDYFNTGVRATTWLGAAVRKYHRTVEEYFTAMRAGGFVVDALREACPRPDMFSDVETYQRRKRIPLFLIIAGTRR